jgi:replicative DNA helicase
MNNIKFSYGDLYEKKLIAAIFKDKIFFTEIYEILKQQYFSNEYNNKIYELTINYFNEYKELPSLTYFKTEIEKLSKDSIYKDNIINALREIIIQKDATDLPYIKKSSKTFCQNQKMKNALYESVDLLENEEYDKIFSLMKDAVLYSIPKDIGHKYKEQIKLKYENAVRDTIETPWEVINEIIGGGVAKGELHIAAGLPGTGKSWFLVAIGAHALKLGYNVLHYTLELDEDYVAFRYDAHFTGMDINKLKYEDKDKIESKINDLINGRLIINSMQSYNTSVDTLEMHIDRLQLVEDFYPDLVIIDYPDLMIPSFRIKRKEGKEYQDIQDIYRELRGFGRRLNFPIWGVSQINKRGIEDDYITEDKLAASFGKLMEADFLMSFSRKIQDQLAQTVRFMILKNRFGPDKLKYTGKFDPTIGSIEIYFQNSEDDKNAKDNMDDEDTTRFLLSQKYKEIFNKSN